MLHHYFIPSDTPESYNIMLLKTNCDCIWTRYENEVVWSQQETFSIPVRKYDLFKSAYFLKGQKYIVIILRDLMPVSPWRRWEGISHIASISSFKLTWGLEDEYLSPSFHLLYYIKSRLHTFKWMVELSTCL